MAWNPSPKVAALRDVVDKFGGNKAVLMLVDESKGCYEVVTYGKTKRECDEARGLGYCAEESLEHYYDLEGRK